MPSESGCLEIARQRRAEHMMELITKCTKRCVEARIVLVLLALVMVGGALMHLTDLSASR